MQEPKLSDILTICFNHNLPFYSYRMPQSNEIITGIQTTPEIIRFKKLADLSIGFIAAPFDKQSDSKAVFISADISFVNEKINDFDYSTLKSTIFDAKGHISNSCQISKNEYLDQAAKLIIKLQNKELEKVVLSRTINTEEKNKLQGINLFSKLTHTYPNAFVSIFHLPGQCTWVGATPETLLKSHKNLIQTMSLAGTKPLDKTILWTEKEREEQQMVSDYVEKILQQFPFTKIDRQGPKDQTAGNLCHLMTSYDCEGELTKNDLFQLIEKLHPTPAVCGIPKQQSLELIRATEHHDREFYAGYLGPISPEGCDLFVNLRCLKLSKDEITLYVGGGITAQSDPEDEWQETCLKADTLLKIIKN